MNEPPRLLDQSESETEKALLHAGRSYRTSSETRAKTLAALGIGSSTAVMVTGGTSAAASVPFAKLTGAKLLVAVSAVGAVSLAPVAYHKLHGKPAAAVSARTVASHEGQEGQGHEGHEGDEGTPALLVPSDLEMPAVTSRAPVARTGAPAPASRPLVRASEAVSLAQELAALDAARSTLARGDAQGALLLLDGYAKTCPQGRLKLEAEMLRIDALAKSGQTQTAKRHAEAFLRRHPGSVLAARARSYTDPRGGSDD